ncbi:hypothetical protein K492DRAFT_147147 [Lichtheimia hyalospora FSU 10163]|nr:hypothetical protein K492DRAFT_147147 [Lichtheimia hyalospora FSU 10163]
MMEKMRMKRESSEDAYSPRQGQTDRQAALEALRQRRCRDSSTEIDTKHARSESPHHTVKIKKLDDAPSIVSRSVSPPASSGKHHLPKPHEMSQPKKKKSSKASSRANGETQGKHYKAKAAHQEDLDFVRVKAKDQVPVTTFWGAMDYYFRQLTEDDRKFLLEKGDDVKPFLIPPLGQHYLETWANEEANVVPPNSTHTRGRSNSPAPNNRIPDPDISMTGNGASSSSETLPPERVRYLKQGEAMTDDYLLTDDLSCGSLTERLLSSLVLEDLVDVSEIKAMASEEEEEDDDPMDTDSVSSYSGGRTITELAPGPPDDIIDFEERLKRELRYAGLFTDDDIDWNAREDDEICAELRKLGRELEEQARINEHRKSKLLEVVDQQLQYEQYRSVLDTYDQQVEQCYAKRFRVQKSKKRKATAPRAVLSENTVNAMEKRRTWKSELGPLFEDKNMTMPNKSIYNDQDDEETSATDTPQEKPSNNNITTTNNATQEQS